MKLIILVLLTFCGKKPNCTRFSFFYKFGCLFFLTYNRSIICIRQRLEKILTEMNLGRQVAMLRIGWTLRKIGTAGRLM